jgi:hypothetical protein
MLAHPALLLSKSLFSVKRLATAKYAPLLVNVQAFREALIHLLLPSKRQYQ